MLFSWTINMRLWIWRPSWPPCWFLRVAPRRESSISRLSIQNGYTHSTNQNHLLQALLNWAFWYWMSVYNIIKPPFWPPSLTLHRKSCPRMTKCHQTVLRSPIPTKHKTAIKKTIDHFARFSLKTAIFPRTISVSARFLPTEDYNWSVTGDKAT